LDVKGGGMDRELAGLIHSLQQACESKNWEQLQLLDQKIKSNLQSSISTSINEEEKVKLMSDLKSIQKIYELVIDDSKKHQLEISTELKKLTRDQLAANSYFGVSQF